MLLGTHHKAYKQQNVVFNIKHITENRERKHTQKNIENATLPLLHATQNNT